MDRNSTERSRMYMRHGGIILVEMISGMLVGVLLAVGGGWLGRWMGQDSATGWGDLIWYDTPDPKVPQHRERRMRFQGEPDRAHV